MKKHLRKAAAVLSAVMVFSSVLGGVTMAEVRIPPNTEQMRSLQHTTEEGETTATPSNVEIASPGNAREAVIAISASPELTFVEDCVVEYSPLYPEGSSVSNIQFTFKGPEDEAYEYSAYFDLTGPDGLKKEKILQPTFDGTGQIRNVGFTTEETLKAGHYEISARIIWNYEPDTIIGTSTNKLTFDVGRDLEITSFPIQTLDGRESSSEDYELYPAVIYMFGKSDCINCQNTLANLNSTLGSYNQGEIKAFFFDTAGEPEETQKLAASSKKIEFCNQKLSGIDYDQYGNMLAAEYDVPWTHTPGIFVFSRGKWAVGSGDGEWSSEKFSQTLDSLGAIKTEKKKTAVKDFYQNHKFNLSGSPSWAEQPSWKPPYRAGKLSESSVQDGLNALNFVRFIADVPAGVTSNEEYEEMAQAGTVIMQRIGEMTHYPEQPADMPNDFFELGYLGTSQSNIASTTGRSLSLSYNIINQWMEDGDSSNIDRVGHRRWCLNPAMTQTGFGVTGGYSAMYSFDGSREDAPESTPYVTWPGKVMPYEYFKGPWSVSVDSSRYTIDKENAAVTLTSGSKTYRLSSRENNGYFNVDQGGYGMGDTIIFKPLASFGSSSTVTVTVEGVQNLEGDPKELVYTVNFFNMSGSSGGGSSSGGGGSHSGGGSSGGGGGTVTGGSGKGPSGAGTASIPDYVIKGNWVQADDLNWKFIDSNGVPYINKWAAIENPYANTASGQSPFDWFYFDANGNMVTGWHQDGENLFYLNQNSDGTRGRMVTGWFWISDQNGVQKCYYFNPNSDGTRGKLIRNSVIDGNTINANGEWVVNGVVQTK